MATRAANVKNPRDFRGGGRPSGDSRFSRAARGIDPPADRTPWIVRLAHQNRQPGKRMGVARRLRLRLFVFLRQISRPAYYAYGLGDEVRLSVEVMPVRVR